MKTIFFRRRGGGGGECHSRCRRGRRGDAAIEYGRGRAPGHRPCREAYIEIGGLTCAIINLRERKGHAGAVGGSYTEVRNRDWVAGCCPCNSCPGSGVSRCEVVYACNAAFGTREYAEDCEGDAHPAQ